MKTSLPDGNYLVPGKPGYEKDSWPRLEDRDFGTSPQEPRSYILHVEGGICGLTPVMPKGAQERLGVRPEIFIGESWQNYAEKFQATFNVNIEQLIKNSLAQKQKQERKMAKIEDGWYRLMGEDDRGQRGKVDYNNGIVTESSRNHYAAYVLDGKVITVLPLGNLDPGVDQAFMESNWRSYRENPNVYGDKYIAFCEKAWNCKIVDLLPGVGGTGSGGVARTAALTLGGVGLLAFVGRLVKNHRQANQARQQKQLQVAKQVQEQQQQQAEKAVVSR